MPFTHRNLKDDLEDVGSNFDGPPDLVESPDRHLPAAKTTLAVEPAEAGTVAGVDVRAVGLSVNVTPRSDCACNPLDREKWWLKV